MSVKDEAIQRYFLANPQEYELAKRMDEAFDITHGEKRGRLSFWFAEPKAQTRERFGLQKEVLVLFSPHARTDARVLTEIENITRAPEFKHRLERLLVLLIHSGSDEETRDLTAKQQDWVVACLTTNELLKPNRGQQFIRSRLAEVLGTIDLYGVSSPLQSDRQLFGREELVQTLLARSMQKAESSGVFGLRKTGKTSVLFAVQRRLAGRPVLSEYFDCQNPGLHASRWWQVLETIASRLANATVPRTVLSPAEYSPTRAASSFSNEMQRIFRDSSIENIVLLLDEIEWITPGLSGALGQHWDEDFLPFWQTIRAVHHETNGRLTFIVAGVNPASVQETHFGGLPNPIFQLAVPQFLEPLKPTHVREMVRSIGKYAGLAFDEPVFSFLTDTFGGHPYLIRLACSEVWRDLESIDLNERARVEISNFERCEPNTKARLSQPVKDILLSLVWWYPDEYELLLLLARGDHEFVKQYVEANPASASQFVKYGILKAIEGDFAIDYLREFLERSGAEYKNEISPFRRGDIPPEMLPEVPDLERLARLFEKRTQIEVALRRIIMVYLGVRCHWNEPDIVKLMVKGIFKRNDRPKPEELFVGRSPQTVINDLYTLDLKFIISKNWDIFGGLFGGKQERFEMNMDTINRARRVEGHTKPLTAAEMSEFENSYSWVYSRVSGVPI